MSYPALGSEEKRVRWWCSYCNKMGVVKVDFDEPRTAELVAVDEHDSKSPECEGLTVNLETFYIKKGSEE